MTDAPPKPTLAQATAAQTLAMEGAALGMSVSCSLGAHGSECLRCTCACHAR